MSVLIAHREDTVGAGQVEAAVRVESDPRVVGIGNRHVRQSRGVAEHPDDVERVWRRCAQQSGCQTGSSGERQQRAGTDGHEALHMACGR